MVTNIFQWRSLKTRVTLVTLAIFIGGIWSLAFYASRMLHEDMQRLLGEQQFASATFIARDLDQELGDRLHALETISGRLHPTELDNASGLQKFLEDRTIFQGLFNAGVVIYRRDGTAIAEVPRTGERIGVNYMKRNVIAAALNEGRATISPPVVDNLLLAPALAMAVPIRDAQGIVIGALSGETNMDRPNFLDKIKEGRYGKTGGYLLIAPQHRLIITATDTSRIMQKLPAPGAHPLIDRFIQGFEGYTVFVNPMGVEVLSSAVRVPVTGWILATTLPTEEAFAPIRAMQRHMLLATILLTLLAGSLTWWFLKRQLTPLSVAVGALTSMSGSKQPLLPLPITRLDEIGDLIGGFNRLLGTLNHRETLLRQILDTSSVAIFLVDLNGRITQANQRMAEMFGCSLEALEGSEYVTLVHPSERDIARQKMLALLASTIPAVDLDRRYWRADHSEFWGRLTGKRFFDANGEEHGLVGVIADITERKQAQDVLRASEERSHAIAESAFDAIITADEAGRIVGWNPAAERIFGYTESEIIGQALTQLMSARDRDAHLAGFHRARTDGVPGVLGKRIEVTGVRKDASEFPMDLTRSKWVGQGGLFFTGIVRDISERRAQETQLKLAAQVFAQAREGITVTDAQRNIIMVNEAFTGISGYTEAEVLGKNPRVMSSGRQDPEFYRAMWALINTEGHWAGEIWNRHKNGTVYAEWLEISVLRDAKGQVTHYAGTFSDLSASKAAENRIQWLSHFDALTGLPNHAMLEDRTTLAISMMQRANEPLTMMLVGFDHFRSVNDALGPQVGDTLLMEMAKRLSHALREQDTVARSGGKEFVLVLPGTSSGGAAHLAAELLWKLAEPYDLGDQETTLTASIGIATYPDNGGDFNTLFKAAVIALHRAQALGRDSFHFYSEDIYQQVLAREHMTKALRHAVKLDQLQLVYQPLVDLQTGQISGMEALLRWQHPELGAVSPAQFIPLAEESGLIKNIGEWVLRRACRDIRNWLDSGLTIPPVAINVSPLQFRDPDLVAQVRNALSGSRLDAGLIYIEVTESALMDNVPGSEAMLKELKDLGIKLSLDDFGTGYSSLSYLKRFSFDKVKIDQSFVRDVATSQSDNVLVKVIISMAHGLGMKVVAEGVETEAQCEIMRSSVCDEIQGYFFSRPVSAPGIEKLFAEGRQLPPHLLRLQKPQRTLLLVDDEPNIVASLKRLFRRDGLLILTASSGAEGLDMLSRYKVDVIISDQRMPGMSGVEFLRAAKASHPGTIRIVLSGFTELQSVTDAINEGAVYRFLTKPWDDEQLREHVQQAFAYKELQEENEQLNIKIRTTNQELVAANRQLGEVLQQAHHQLGRDETSLAIMREALQHIPLPVIGVDKDGLMALVNTAAERLFAREGPLLGIELASTLPTLDATLAISAEGLPHELLIEGNNYLVKWDTMGAHSRSQGKLVTFTPSGART
jgi:diguanylate cyclase (GGDEF)-like protein/PAS domain S-box-containing protein